MPANRNYLKIPPQKLIELASELDVDETIRLNHEDCPAGQDTRSRLYITKKRDLYRVVMVAYCHNCGLSQSKHITVSSTPIPRIVRPLLPSVKEERKGLTLEEYNNLLKSWGIPIDKEQDWVSWPIPVQSYLITRGIETRTNAYVLEPYIKQLLINNLITWSENRQTVIFAVPSYNNESDMFSVDAIIERNLIANIYSKEIKYKNTYFKYPFSPSIINYNIVSKREGNPRSLFIVEDIVSAHRIVSLNNCYKDIVEALPLLSTNLSIETIQHITKQDYNNIIVWLDNDSKIVTDKANYIQSILSALNNNTKVIAELRFKDPKLLTNKELLSIINTYI